MVSLHCANPARDAIHATSGMSSSGVFDEFEKLREESVGSVLDLVEDRCDSVEGVWACLRAAIPCS